MNEPLSWFERESKLLAEVAYIAAEAREALVRAWPLDRARARFDAELQAAAALRRQRAAAALRRQRAASDEEPSHIIITRYM